MSQGSSLETTRTTTSLCRSRGPSLGYPPPHVSRRGHSSGYYRRYVRSGTLEVPGRGVCRSLPSGSRNGGWYVENLSSYPSPRNRSYKSR